jgi:GxxExxY protein
MAKSAVHVASVRDTSGHVASPVLASVFRVKEHLNALTNAIIGAALAVHDELGPGLLESAYEACLTFELLQRRLSIERQKALPLTYRGQTLDCGYRLDLLVEGVVVVEVKAIEQIQRVHKAQLLSYLRLSRCKVGLLINFNVRWLVRDGVRRVVNGFPD